MIKNSLQNSHIFQWSELSIDRKVFLILRISVALCFLGHGAFGFIIDNGNMGKAAWLEFFKPFGLEPELVYKFMLMPLVGAFDIFIFLAVLFFPMRCILVWAVFWTIFTAFLRPLAGQGIFEFFERGGNYGPPLALMLFCGLHFHSLSNWFSIIKTPRISTENITQLIFILRLTITMLLIGHGGFFVVNENNQRDYLIQHWAVMGLDLTASGMLFIGFFEITLGILAFLKPVRYLLIFIAVWKLFSESLYWLSGVPNPYIWEWVERSGSYLAPLALIFLIHWKKQSLLARPSFSHLK